MARQERPTDSLGQPQFRNEHCAYSELSRRDRHAIRDILKTSFPIGKSSHELWSEFRDTTAFIRRAEPADSVDLAEGVIGGAIVMSYPEDQYDYLAYIAIHPAFRHRRRFFPRANDPHHGSELLHYVYDVMHSRVSPERMQRCLMIEPAGDDALRFYLKALPTNEYPVRFDPEERVFAVAYDGLTL
ncbi:hypothetical protein ATK74_1894 [Propionicimonas paludicola]|uniref:N-acetyltransferase domain-containing protein n=1 Tax=Propionicimonas paludicola TaxID=185243 RepID=A0A2A9CSA5_9ACTN|nr:hypothetical protein [Propionicimonas paludicola]PFG17327.1 hypothetical protein ATK74_1894 [Propionicimonas paludicola]